MSDVAKRTGKRIKAAWRFRVNRQASLKEWVRSLQRPVAHALGVPEWLKRKAVAR